MKLPLSLLAIASRILLAITAVRADGHDEGDFCPTLFLTEDGKSLTIYDAEEDISLELGTFGGRNPIRDMAVDPTDGTIYGLQGNVPGTNTRLIVIDPFDATRETVVNVVGFNIQKMAFDDDGGLFVTDNQGTLWSLFPDVVQIGNPGVIASALTFAPDGTLLLLQERDPGRFFMWSVSTEDGSATRLGKVKGIGGQRQGAQVSFATAMYYNPGTGNIVISTFRNRFTRIFETSIDTIVNGGFAEKVVPRTREVRLAIAGIQEC